MVIGISDHLALAERIGLVRVFLVYTARLADVPVGPCDVASAGVPRIGLAFAVAVAWIIITPRGTYEYSVLGQSDIDRIDQRNRIARGAERRSLAGGERHGAFFEGTAEIRIVVTVTAVIVEFHACRIGEELRVGVVGFLVLALAVENGSAAQIILLIN